MRMTAHEIAFIVVILGALLIGAATKYYRDTQRAARSRVEATAPAATPKPQYLKGIRK